MHHVPWLTTPWTAVLLRATAQYERAPRESVRERNWIQRQLETVTAGSIKAFDAATDTHVLPSRPTFPLSSAETSSEHAGELKGPTIP
jgi:hypothetical protein